MPSVADLIRSNYEHRGVVWTPPNGRSLIVTPAHHTNYSIPGDGQYRGTKHNDCVITHTPEEDADENEVTPRLFSRANYGASTHAYTDNDGDLYAMVPFEFTAWAQGARRRAVRKPDGTVLPVLDRYVVKKRPYPDWFAKDENGVVLSFNQLGNSNEVEGRAESMDETFKVGGNQWDTYCSWTGWNMFQFGWDEQKRICSHMQFSVWRSDPGSYVIGLFPKIHDEARNHRDAFEAKAAGTTVLRQKPPEAAPTPPPAPAAPATDPADADALKSRVARLEAIVQAMHVATATAQR